MIQMDRKDFTKAVKNALADKTLVLGIERTMKLGKAGALDLIAYVGNCPEKEALGRVAAEKGTPVFEFDGTNTELGELCKKPFRVSAMGVRKREAK